MRFFRKFLYAGTLLFSLVIATPSLAGGWPAQNSGTSNAINGLRYRGAVGEGTVAVAVGSGEILRSINDGATWTIEHSGAYVWNDVDGEYVSANNDWTFWAVGNQSRVARSTNGGDTWTVLPDFSATTHYFGVDFFSAAIGYRVGRNDSGSGAVSYTDSGGSSWLSRNLALPAGTGALYDIVCSNGATCYAVGSGGKILKTTTSGLSWTTEISGTTETLKAIVKLPSNAGWVAVGENGTLRKKTSDAATTWSNPLTLAYALDFSDIDFITANDGWLVVEEDILVTHDGGASWSYQTSRPGTAPWLNAIDVLNLGSDKGLAVGNSGTILGYDTSPPTGTVSINAGAAYTNSTAATLTLTCSSAGGECMQIRVATDDTADTEYYSSFETPRSVTLPAGDGAKTIAVQFKDRAGFESAQATDAIILDTTPPAMPAGLTRTSAATDTTPTFTWGVATDNVGVTTYAVHLQNSLENTVLPATDIGDLLTYTVADSGALTPGAYRILVSAKDAAGNSSGFVTLDFTISTPPPAGDTTAPTGTVMINNGASRTNSAAVTLAMTCSDNVACAQMRFSNDGTSAWAAWETFAATKSWTVATGNGNKVVYGQFRDAAANISAGFINDSIVLDTVAPAVTGISVSATLIRGSAQDISASFSDGDGVSACSLLVNGASTALMNMTPAKNGTASIAYVFSSVGTYTVQVRCNDGAGNMGTSESVTRTVTEPVPGIDTLPPTAPTNLARVTVDTDTTPTFTWSAATDASGISSYEAAVDSVGAYQGIDNALSWTISESSPLSSGTHTVRIRAIDNSFNRNIGPAASITFTITLSDITAPDTTITSAPPLSTIDMVATFSFMANEVATFNCSLDGGSFSVCSSPYTFSGLTQATHSFSVRATDLAGNIDGTPATYSWAVAAPASTTDTTSPSAPGNLTRTSPDSDTTPTFNWAAATDNMAVVSYEVQVDTSTWTNVGGVLTFTTTELTLGTHTINVRARDGAGNASTASSLTFTISATTTGGGGGTTGGGGGGSSGGGTSGGDTTGGGGGTSTVVGVSGPPFTLAQMETDAGVVARQDLTPLLSLLRYASSVACQMDIGIATAKAEDLFGMVVRSGTGAAIINFTACGTLSTLHLGAGERLGVVNSYKSAFGRLPSTSAHWFDVIKIANGRFPGETSATAEAGAKTRFRQIYLRVANMSQQNDSAAVNVMAYGLRPLPRNVGSEAAAISIYKKIFGRTPSSATEWDALRAIAYSGARR